MCIIIIFLSNICFGCLRRNRLREMFLYAPKTYVFYRESYMSAHVLLNLLNELGKEIKCEACINLIVMRNYLACADPESFF